VIAFKFLRRGRVAPFTGFTWPTDAWVEAERVEPCRGGVHACRPQDLPYWLASELWEIELAGEIREQEHKVVAARGRLVRQRDDWTEALLDAFAHELARRARSRLGHVPLASGYVADVERFRRERRHGLAAFAAARGAEIQGGPAAYDRERLRQAEWLRTRLGLEAV
jgi:hypothetical protein